MILPQEGRVEGGILLFNQFDATFQLPEPIKVYVLPVFTPIVMMLELAVLCGATVNIMLGRIDPELGPVVLVQAIEPPAPSAW